MKVEEKQNNNNNQEKNKEKNTPLNEEKENNNVKQIKTNTESTEINANIEMRKECKNKKRKKIKIRAYCSKCYQFFENGPYSKICRNHLQKSCNLIECQKFKQSGENACIRKFTNIYSANRHTHCLTQKDIEIWDPNCEIQKCLGKKTEPENKFLDILNNNNNNINNSINIFSGINKSYNNKSFFSDINNSLNMNFNNMNNIFLEKNDNFFDTNSNNGNNNVMELIEDIDKLHFNESEKIFKSDINNNVNNNEKNNNDDNNNEKDINIKLEKMNINEEKKEEDKSIKENESIDEFFEKVQKETNIPNNIKKKLANAFKKKGILNVKILLLFYEKYKSWDFLIQKFKNVTPQIEGVALCIEFLLKKN